MLSHTYRPVVPMTPCSLRALFLGQLLPWELKQNMHSKVGGEELLIAGTSSGVNWKSQPLDYFLHSRGRELDVRIS